MKQNTLTMDIENLKEQVLEKIESLVEQDNYFTNLRHELIDAGEDSPEVRATYDYLLRMGFELTATINTLSTLAACLGHTDLMLKERFGKVKAISEELNKYYEETVEV